MEEKCKALFKLRLKLISRQTIIIIAKYETVSTVIAIVMVSNVRT